MKSLFKATWSPNSLINPWFTEVVHQRVSRCQHRFVTLNVWRGFFMFELQVFFSSFGVKQSWPFCLTLASPVARV